MAVVEQDPKQHNTVRGSSGNVEIRPPNYQKSYGDVSEIPEIGADPRAIHPSMYPVEVEDMVKLWGEGGNPFLLIEGSQRVKEYVETVNRLRQEEAESYREGDKYMNEVELAYRIKRSELRYKIHAYEMLKREYGEQDNRVIELGKDIHMDAVLVYAFDNLYSSGRIPSPNDIYTGKDGQVHKRLSDELTKFPR